MITPNWTLRGEFLHYWFDKAQAATVTRPWAISHLRLDPL
jgi:hypothetical protein